MTEYLSRTPRIKRIRDMNHLQIDNFRALAPIRLPGITESDGLEYIDDYDDYALLTYQLPKPVGIQDLMDQLEDNMGLNILYHSRNSFSESSPQHCCAYSSPTYEAMYKFNAQTDANGMVTILYVYIFESLEVMLEYLKEDLRQHSKAVQFQGMELPRLVADFM